MPKAAKKENKKERRKINFLKIKGVRKMNKKKLSRREFLTVASTGTIIAATSGRIGAYANAGKKTGKAAILGGKAIRTKPYPGWPVWDRSAEKHIISILRSGKWYRGGATTVTEFEKKYAELMGVKRCVCTVNGTNALLTAMHALDVGVGDGVSVGGDPHPRFITRVVPGVEQADSRDVQFVGLDVGHRGRSDHLEA